MAELASFWVGDRLGPIEIASLRSFLRQGDHVTVYSPAPMEGLPEGVLWRDASEIMPCDRIIRHRRTQSPALHSDLFRYQLLAKTDQIWVDLDMIALRPFEFGSEWVFGHETPQEVNGAVLHLPRQSETLRKLLLLTPETRGLPPFLTGMRRAKYWLRSFGRGLPLDRWPWGGIGPRALTYYLKQTGEMSHALPVSAFYFVPMQEAARFVEPGGIRRADLPQDAWAVHLWGKQLRQAMAAYHSGQVPRGSFLDLALREEL
ncbi:hypothetical protein SAMN04489859_10119 [Paracoccus alcaliphilus]|uniref:Alpha 1,4-glycosyltransferase conserved region n=1 Tax=Paracoccus alcaliphilus TaxID=34002 RepID=A0A1H8HYL8_9RHOB|nr:hypothetical protein [Paracoccus alcaliphilus]WCR19580.1 hypothetical protein JHW40_07980 [Paracoccus alcaliphilus]SEN61167.1 hypothetical protein SAMN04489859_10119 [Paracoccus alcaliphilus]